MFFHSQLYLIFFLVVFALYWATPWARARVWILLGASFLFYASWSRWLALLVVTASTLDYVFARLLDGSERPWRRRFFLGCSLAMNVGLLCYFKYVNFFLASLRESLQWFGLSMSPIVLDIVIPFGISFYTFEAISYSVDVYKRRIPAERSLPSFLLFILFFPHLVAGPIVRAGDFLPQVARPKRFSWFRARAGVELFLLGLFKKMVIADWMAVYSRVLIDPAVDVATISPYALWVGLLAFTVQIYCDFSGYSDMALGSAHLLGYKLTVNFRMPYLALNIADFWRRWHISLSTWIRDYLFIPLGGSRGGSLRVCFNVVFVMVLCGLWHGATWAYVVFGLLHGVLLFAHRSFARFCKERPALSAYLGTTPGTVLRWATTFVVVMLLMVFIQNTLGRSVDILHRMFSASFFAGLGVGRTLAWVWIALALMIAGHALGSVGKRRWSQLPAEMAGLGYGLGLVFCFLLAPPNNQSFIYFQF